MGQGPDKIVREAEARQSVEDLTRGIAEDAKAAGKLPRMREIEAYAQEVTREQINRHEDAAARGLLDAKPKVEVTSPAKLDQGAWTDDLGDAVKIARPFDPERHAKKTKLISSAEHAEAFAAAKRLDVLLAMKIDDSGAAHWVHHDWAERVHNAYNDAFGMARASGLDVPTAKSVATDAVLTVLDESSRVFGDWRMPVKQADKPIIIVQG